MAFHHSPRTISREIAFNLDAINKKIAEEEEKILQYLIELEKEYEGFKEDAKGRYRKDGKFISNKKKGPQIAGLFNI